MSISGGKLSKNIMKEINKIHFAKASVKQYNDLMELELRRFHCYFGLAAGEKSG